MIGNVQISNFFYPYLGFFTGHFGPKVWKKWARKLPVEVVWEVKEQKYFVVITPSYNNAQWCEKNLRSILKQDYENYRVIYTIMLRRMEHLKKLKQLFSSPLILSALPSFIIEHNQGAAANLYKAVHMCGDDEIAVLLDGDDQLAHDGVLKKLNSIYANPDVWVTYGSYVEYPSYKKGGWAKPCPLPSSKKTRSAPINGELRTLKLFMQGYSKKFIFTIFFLREIFCNQRPMSPLCCRF